MKSDMVLLGYLDDLLETMEVNEASNSSKILHLAVIIVEYLVGI